MTGKILENRWPKVVGTLDASSVYWSLSLFSQSCCLSRLMFLRHRDPQCSLLLSLCAVTIPPLQTHKMSWSHGDTSPSVWIQCWNTTHLVRVNWIRLECCKTVVCKAFIVWIVESDVVFDVTLYGSLFLQHIKQLWVWSKTQPMIVQTVSALSAQWFRKEASAQLLWGQSIDSARSP